MLKKLTHIHRQLIDNLFRGALPEGNRSDDDVFRMRESFLKYYNAHNCDLTKPYDGITDMLRTLSSKGVALAVASNKYQFGTETLINRYFPDIHFTHILGQREGRNVKPDPQIIYDAMDGFNKESTFYCGDSDVDMMTGNNAGVKTIGVTWGFRKREELKRHNPWLLVDSPSEIVSAVMDSKK